TQGQAPAPQGQTATQPPPGQPKAATPAPQGTTPPPAAQPKTAAPTSAQPPKQTPPPAQAQPQSSSTAKQSPPPTKAHHKSKPVSPDISTAVEEGPVKKLGGRVISASGAKWTEDGARQMRQRHFKEAIISLKEATKTDPKHPVAWNNLGSA